MSACTCGEPPMSGHYLWCGALRGQREYRPATPSRLSAEELRAVLTRVEPTLVADVQKAIDGDPLALQIVCNFLNARGRNGGAP